MAPIPQRTQQRASPAVAGYVASGLRSGVYTSIPHLVPPTGLAAARVAELTQELVTTRPGELARWLSSRPRPAGAGFERVLRDLSRHTRTLDAMLKGPTPESSATLAEVKAVLAHLPAAARELLANEKEHTFKPFGYEDALALAAARWFKHEYFRWVDPIKCAQCGGETRGTGAGQPTAEERAGGAGRVELHTCVNCAAVRRFPRYNEVKALMGSREGRCGEFAQLFYVFFLALGLEARYVWNSSEDHVWTEYWSPELGHWVHIDSEAETSKPLLYDRGWGKKQAHCSAVGASGAEDVTRAYVDGWDECLARRRAKDLGGGPISEAYLAQLITALTVECRAHLDDEERARLESMDEAQQRWIDDEKGRWREAELVNLRGRESGPEEWRAERDELGAGGAGE
ncbi:Peptide-N(4)-(N-acetyl-beta-glucosaminyl)asparagine amidase [Vanrija pseudolonga]|uniref:Peptide-N(4)-(N-acetyl-beta-glucosaminyl)asparagine amidase n=1 Tax=Vanrija pseudolonga TaxID=143232 RepID=A0AAF0YEF8_9TREE|nr:Peptide-N(4)-(N-acetyl-beta-glucosaminyl)asparagine amidase [Vanrija pseudolonga]